MQVPPTPSERLATVHELWRQACELEEEAAMLDHVRGIVADAFGPLAPELLLQRESEGPRAASVDAVVGVMKELSQQASARRRRSRQILVQHVQGAPPVGADGADGAARAFKDRVVSRRPLPRVGRDAD